LRGFGIDVNRAWIYIYKNNCRISDLAFQRAVRDTILEVEKAYWALVQARRDIVITSRLLADFERIYDYLEARRQYDVMEVQLAETKADLDFARAEFVQRRATVFDAEDRLIAAMNSPDVTLADNIEIIPEDFPQLTPFVVDRLAEVQTALAQKPEVQEARLRVDNAKIAVGQAKNAELPKLDVNFTYTIQGLAGTADKSFDEVSRHKFVTYYTGVQFEMPIGNRGPRAAHHRARFEHAAAKAALKAEFENTIFAVNVAARGLTTSYDQIMPAFESTEARERQVESIIARAERKDIATLSTELGAHRNLAETRRSLLRVMIAYNVAIIELEKAKGTLLRFYNVVIPTEEEE
jgi:outer membrane protein TolC